MFPASSGLGTFMKLCVVGILCLSVTACIPGITVPISSGPPKPTSDVTNSAAVTPRDGAGAIVITRDAQFRDMKCIYDILLDGQRVAGLRIGEKVTLYADPGQRIVGVSIRRENKCDPAVAQFSVQVVASATTNVRVSTDVSYDLKIEATTY
jgi:hypothetical protein